MVRQKGRQYTLSMLVSSILIAVVIFGISFIGAMFFENYYLIKDDPYDYSYLAGFTQKGMDKEKIERLAFNYDVDIQKFIELDLLLIGREHQYDEETTEWSGQYVTNVDSHHALVQEDINLREGECIFYVQYIDAPEFKTIQNNQDYERLKAYADQRYQVKYYLFHAPDTAHSAEFFHALLQEAVDAGGGRMLDNFFDAPVRELMIAGGKNVKADDNYIDYKGNELYAARWWDMCPFSKKSALAAQFEIGAVYLLLMTFIRLF